MPGCSFWWWASVLSDHSQKFPSLLFGGGGLEIMWFGRPGCGVLRHAWQLAHSVMSFLKEGLSDFRLYQKFISLCVWERRLWKSRDSEPWTPDLQTRSSWRYALVLPEVHLPAGRKRLWVSRDWEGVDFRPQAFLAANPCSQEAGSQGWILCQPQARCSVSIRNLKVLDNSIIRAWPLTTSCFTALAPPHLTSLQDHVRSFPSPQTTLLARLPAIHSIPRLLEPWSLCSSSQRISLKQ
jgi:hypothetical protein